MKKILILTLAAILLLTACSSSALVETGKTGEPVGEETASSGSTTETRGAHDPTGFSTGFAREDITPDYSVPLGGYNGGRFSTKVLDDVYVTCVAISDGEDTLLFYSYDLINIYLNFGETVRSLVAKATGVPEENILLNATHTHSAPALGSTEGIIATWLRTTYLASVEVAKAAIADLDKTELKVAKTETDRLNFNRRYFASDGGFVTDNYSTSTTNVCVSHETQVDQEMRIVYFDRANQPDIVFSNWQCHPHRTGGGKKTDMSADIIGPFRDKVEEELGVKFMYLQGGAGNCNETSRISGETRFTEYREHGRALADALIAGIQKLVPAESGKVRAERRVFTATVRHTEDHLVPVAEEVNVLSNAGKYDEATELAKAKGLTSRYEASEIIHRAGLGETEDFYLYCYAFGSVGIATAPFEIFDTTAKYVRDNSPFEFNLYCGYSNDRRQYLPTALSFQNKGYEYCCCRYVSGTAEAISEVHLEMLADLYAIR